MQRSAELSLVFHNGSPTNKRGWVPKENMAVYIYKKLQTLYCRRHTLCCYSTGQQDTDEKGGPHDSPCENQNKVH